MPVGVGSSYRVGADSEQADGFAQVEFVFVPAEPVEGCCAEGVVVCAGGVSGFLSEPGSTDGMLGVGGWIDAESASDLGQ